MDEKELKYLKQGLKMAEQAIPKEHHAQFFEMLSRTMQDVDQKKQARHKASTSTLTRMRDDKKRRDGNV